MGQATIYVAPEIIGHFVAMLPSTTRVIGSRDNEGAIAIVLESALLADGPAYGLVHIDGLKTTFELKQSD